ncbi:MAG: SIS domain-containing protein, partial [Lentisphaeria bacterium]|nr:SIS domain-containing protein [Lentisphaeria bacterium]
MGDKRSTLDIAREVFDIEIEGVVTLRDKLGADFEKLADRCASAIDAGGKIVLTGVGKSGYIGKKIAATLSSVGNPAVFMHPVEARHGDLGLLQKNDLLIALSYSGETEELLVVLTPAKRLGVELIAITGNRESSLAKMSDFVMEMAVPKEACPFNLAPTTTTTEPPVVDGTVFFVEENATDVDDTAIIDAIKADFPDKDIAIKKFVATEKKFGIGQDFLEGVYVKDADGIFVALEGAVEEIENEDGSVSEWKMFEVEKDAELYIVKMVPPTTTTAEPTTTTEAPTTAATTTEAPDTDNEANNETTGDDTTDEGG